MPILDTTTCMMACLAAFGDSPNRFPFSSVTGMPYFSSLNDTATRMRTRRRRERRPKSSPLQRNEAADVAPSHLCLMKGMLMQLAAATAANGTNRLTIGGRRCGGGRWSGGSRSNPLQVHQFVPQEPAPLTEARDLSPRAVTTAPVVALT